MLGQYGHAAGADLVGGVAIGGHPVAAHEHGVDPAVLHDLGGHVVADDGGVHAVGEQLEGAQPRALEQGTGLVGENPEIHAPLAAQVQRRQGGAVFGGGQLARVAMGQYAVAVLDEGQAVLADGAAHPNVLLLDGDALVAQQGHDLGDGLVPVVQNHPFHAVQRPAEVHRRGTGGIQVVLVGLELLIEGIEVVGDDLPGGQVDAERRRAADGRRAAHLQQVDGVPDVLDLGQVQHLHHGGQPGLVQYEQRAVFVVQRHGLIAHDALVFLCHGPFLLTWRPRRRAARRSRSPRRS